MKRARPRTGRGVGGRTPDPGRVGPTSPPARPAKDDATLTLDLPGGAVTLHCEVSVGPARLAELVAPARAMADTLTEAGIAQVAARGQTPSCRQGCAACCRQLIPISTPEARALVERMATLAPALRARVQARFRRALEQGAQAGLLSLRDPPGPRALRVTPRTGESAWDAASRIWFAARIDCPFLEDDACTIYADRPMACREYVVVSDPALCQVLDPGIASTPRHVSLSEALARVAADTEGHDPASFPLFFLLEWAHAHPAARDPTHDGEALFHALIGAMAELGGAE